MENSCSGVDVHLLNSIWFDARRFLAAATRSKLKVVHRVAGPICLARGFDREKDDELYSLNGSVASATVMQSAWSLKETLSLGYKPINPLIIYNAPDPDIFNRAGRIGFDRNRKIRLVASSWSDNPLKGGETYKWLEDNLDWDRYDYTFVGRTQIPFLRAKHIPAVGSEQLAGLYRQHDIYVFASRIEAGSNSLVEALSCGLPVLYVNTSSNGEVVGSGGLPFGNHHDMLGQLERLIDHYETFQNLIVVPALDDVVDRYLELFRELALQ